MRKPNVSRVPFENIFSDFLPKHKIKGKKILDLGPGQWDFAEMVRDRGGICIGIDQDPAVIELGKYKDFEAFNFNLKDIPWTKQYFDGVFAKYSFSAAWFRGDEEAHKLWIANLIKCLLPNSQSWLWLGPWNGSGKAGDPEDEKALFVQAAEMKHHGCRVHWLTEEQSARYGIHGKTLNRVLYTRGL